MRSFTLFFILLIGCGEPNQHWDRWTGKNNDKSQNIEVLNLDGTWLVHQTVDLPKILENADNSCNSFMLIANERYLIGLNCRSHPSLIHISSAGKFTSSITQKSIDDITIHYKGEYLVKEQYTCNANPQLKLNINESGYFRGESNTRLPNVIQVILPSNKETKNGDLNIVSKPKHHLYGAKNITKFEIGCFNKDGVFKHTTLNEWTSFFDSF